MTCTVAFQRCMPHYFPHWKLNLAGISGLLLIPDLWLTPGLSVWGVCAFTALAKSFSKSHQSECILPSISASVGKTSVARRSLDISMEGDSDSIFNYWIIHSREEKKSGVGIEHTYHSNVFEIIGVKNRQWLLSKSMEEEECYLLKAHKDWWEIDERLVTHKKEKWNRIEMFPRIITFTF